MTEKRKLRDRVDGLTALLVVLALVSYALGSLATWNHNQQDQRQRESECRLISGTWAEQRGMCFVPNTTLNGLNP